MTTTVVWPAAWRASMNGAKYGEDADGGPSSLTICPIVSEVSSLLWPRARPANRGVQQRCRPKMPRTLNGARYKRSMGGWFAHQKSHAGPRKSPNSLLEHCPESAVGSPSGCAGECKTGFRVAALQSQVSCFVDAWILSA